MPAQNTDRETDAEDNSQREHRIRMRADGGKDIDHHVTILSCCASLCEGLKRRRRGLTLAWGIAPGFLVG